MTSNQILSAADYKKFWKSWIRYSFLNEILFQRKMLEYQ